MLASGSAGESDPPQGDALMQSAQPRDVGVLILVISMLLVLFVVSLMLGSPIR